MFDRILVPTDGSDAAREAAEHALDLAEQHDSTVHALYAVDMGDADFVVTPSDIAETKDRIRSKGQEFVADIEQLAAERGVSCETFVTTELPHRAILQHADEHDVDLIAIAKSGHTDPDKTTLGSTTEKVAEKADVAVHVV